MPFDDDCRDAKQAEATSNPLAGWPRFAEAVRARLERGREAYGDRSFSRAPDDLAEELREELLDVCGWAYVLAERVERLQRELVAARELAARRDESERLVGAARGRNGAEP